MAFEIKKITEQEIYQYWTPAVCDFLSNASTALKTGFQTVGVSTVGKLGQLTMNAGCH